MKLKLLFVIPVKIQKKTITLEGLLMVVVRLPSAVLWSKRYHCSCVDAVLFIFVVDDTERRREKGDRRAETLNRYSSNCLDGIDGDLPKILIIIIKISIN